jgi:hypothetical protein
MLKENNRGNYTGLLFKKIKRCNSIKRLHDHLAAMVEQSSDHKDLEEQGWEVVVQEQRSLREEVRKEVNQVADEQYLSSKPEVLPNICDNRNISSVQRSEKLRMADHCSRAPNLVMWLQITNTMKSRMKSLNEVIQGFI